MESLGVHEHWNNSTDKQYSRNLGTGEGIELIKLINYTPTSVERSNADIPDTFTLFANYPNPFNPSTTIKYNLQKSDNVTLIIYNISGQEIERLVNEFQIMGEHEITWHPKALSSGIYFYRLKTGEFSKTKKLILQK